MLRKGPRRGQGLTEEMEQLKEEEMNRTKTRNGKSFTGVEFSTMRMGAVAARGKRSVREAAMSRVSVVDPAAAGEE